MKSAFLLTLLILAYTDARYRRIPNAIVGAGMLTIFVFHLFFPDSAGVGLSYGVLCSLIILLMYMLYRLRAFGAGDVKLFMLVLAACPDLSGLMIMALSIMLAGLYAFYRLISLGLLRKRMAYACSYALMLMRMGHGKNIKSLPPYYDKERDGAEAAFAFAPFVFVAAAAVLLGGV